MNKNSRNVTSGACRMMLIAGLLTATVAGFLLLTKPAAMRTDAQQIFDSTEQINTLGRLAFQRTNFFTGGSVRTSVIAVNADGTGATTLAPGDIPLYNAEPAWSPDGAKIAYVVAAIGTDIYTMNADGSNKINITNSAASETNPSWSATGKIAYERDSQIWTMNADGSNQILFSAVTQPAPLAPAWSPDGSKFAFTSGGEIWVINADGSGERRVTNNSTTDADPAWSPDGTKIIFGKGGSGIAVVNLDGTNEMNLTNGAQDGKPAWSSDGTRIAFVRRGAEANGIFVMDASGAHQIRIIADSSVQPNRNENDNPAWQPVPVLPNTFTISGRITRTGASLSGVTVNLSGTTTATTMTDSLGFYQFSSLPQNGNFLITPVLANHIFTPTVRAFTNLTSNQIADFAAGETCSTPNCRLNGKIAFVRMSEIYTMNSDGTNQTNITNNAATDTEPNYSPDGAKIIFASNRDGNNEIYQMNADGSAVVRLTNNAAAETSPAFSPDGLSIVFVSNRDGNNEIYKMNADGTNQIRLTTETARDIVPSFSPDGAKIIFISERPGGPPRIFTMNADGTNQQVLSNGPGFFYNKPSYSPDGTKIIFVYGADVTVQTIWTMNADGSNRQQFPVGRSSPSYSPDGTKVVYVCCFGGGQLQDGVRIANANGTSAQGLTLGAFDDLPDWQPIRPAARRTPFDFDGDGRADIAVFRPSSGFWYRLNSQNNSFAAAQFGISSDRLAPADYDGDGKTDVAVFRDTVPGAGNFAYFYILNSADNSFRPVQFGATGDVPVAGDWDGDGKADLAVYRDGSLAGGQSYFYYRPSSQPTVNFNTIPLGATGDKPLLGDFDGDGRLDPAVFRPSNAIWYILRSSVNQITQTTFGLSTDIPVPADYDGDGRTNIAVFRPSTGTWFTSTNPQNNYGAVQFGANGDLPVPADYDGDGRADVAVFRPSNGAWYLNRSTSGFAGVSFGSAEDKPIPNAFVP